jgi:hypothetical protein
MRKFLISAAVATAALTAAVPAAAQYAPAYGNPYGAPYGQAYGYNGYGQVRSLQARIDNLQREIRRLDQRDVISNREAASLMSDARAVERRLWDTTRRGLSYSERRAVEVRIARLEQRIWREARDGNRYGDRRYGDRSWDRDHDGRADRWEDDRGHDRD